MGAFHFSNTLVTAILNQDETLANEIERRLEVYFNENPGYGNVAVTATGTFVKADFPWAKSIRVRVVGGGGGGGGADDTSATEIAGGGAGGGGGYAEKRILVSALAASETVTIGAAGTAGTGGAAGTAGGAGGTSSFGSHCSASGGAGGAYGAGALPNISNAAGGAAGSGTGGDINIKGARGTYFVGVGNFVGRVLSSLGGASHMGAGGVQQYSSGSVAGVAGSGYGSGGSGAAADNSTSGLGGGAGAVGAVFIEIYG